VWNVRHVWLDAARYLNQITVARHTILPQTSSISDPNRTFIAKYVKVGGADIAAIANDHAKGCFQPPS